MIDATCTSAAPALDELGDMSIPTRDHHTPKWSRGEIAWASVLTAAVAIAGAWQLNRASLWNDEAATWAIAGHSFTDLVQVLRDSGGDRGAALYYLITFGWMRAFGTSEIAMRSLSVAAAAATMAPFYAAARRLVARPAAFAAGAVLAASAFFLTYARDARAYTTAVLLVVLAAWTFVRAVASDTSRDWWIFNAVALLAVYTHWFSALVVLSFFIALCLTRSDVGQRKHARSSAVVLALGMVPIAALVVNGSTNGVDWIAPLNIAELRDVASGFTGSNRLVPEILVFSVVAIGLIGAWKQRHLARIPPLTVTWFVVPVGLTVVISTVKPLLVTRYLIIALPGFALLAGLGLCSLARRRPLGVAVGVVLFAILGASSYDTVWTRNGGREDWRSIASTVARRADAGDAIVVFPATSVSAFAYYARHGALRAYRAGTDWPSQPWDAPFNRQIANSTVLASPAFDGRASVWLIVRAPQGRTVTRAVRDSPVLAELRARLRRHFTVVDEIAPWTDGGTVFVVRYSEPIRA